jgi:phenylalanyl-tRNA synthetase alpha chain
MHGLLLFYMKFHFSQVPNHYKIRYYQNIMDTQLTALKKAQLEVTKENPNLPLPLKFEVSSKEMIDKALAVDDLTLPTPAGTERNIVGKVFDQVVSKLEEKGFENITVVRGDAKVAAADNFDKLLFSPGNPGRSSTYTRYTDEDHVLRTHTSALIPSTYEALDKSKLDKQTFVLPGLVYRRDVIDPRHLDVFHQIDVWTLQRVDKYGKTTREDLLKLGQAVFEAACPDAKMIVLEAKHPYTLDGIEVYAEVGGVQVEVFEAGLAHPEVLRNAGIDPEEFSGLALGMGVERLIMARKNLPDIRLIRSTDPRVVKQMTNMDKFKNVSDQPAISRDMSYCVDHNDSEEDICEKIREVFGDKADLLEEVKILQRTPFAELHPIAKEKLGAKEGQDNVLVRITLRHPDKTLTKQEAAELYEMAYPKLHEGTKGYSA